MPIKGRSEIRQISRVGKIHLGVKKQGVKNGENYEYPSATDYFVVRADDSTTSPAAAKAFKEVYGDKPKEIKVAFPYDEPEKFFPQFYTAYNKSRTKFCEGDGETATRTDVETGTKTEISCLGEKCPFYEKKQCRALARLQFFLPDVPGIGTWQIDTQSWYSTIKLNSAIEMIRALTGGRIKMIPLPLVLVPQPVSPNGKAKTVYVLDIRISDIKLADFIKQIPLLSAVFSPEVEPINMEEVAEDLYIDTEAVGSAVDNKPANTAVTNEQNVDETLPVPEKIAVFIERKMKQRDDDGSFFAVVRLADPKGNIVAGYANDTQLLTLLKHAKEGDLFRYETSEEPDGRVIFTRMVKSAS